jgi:hypothetical protein
MKKNRKSYHLPSKAEVPLIERDRHFLSVWNEKKLDGVEVKLPKWLWECIDKMYASGYEQGIRDNQLAIKSILGVLK